MSDSMLGFTVEELQKELEGLKQSARGQKLTEEQFDLLRYARSGERKVDWPTLGEWFKKKGFIEIGYKALGDKYRKMCKERGLDA